MVGVSRPDSHMHRMRWCLRCESEWSLAIAATMPHGDYINHMAHMYVYCAHTYVYIHTHTWTAMCALRSRASTGCRAAATATVTASHSIVLIQVRSLHAVGLLCSSNPSRVETSAFGGWTFFFCCYDAAAAPYSVNMNRPSAFEFLGFWAYEILGLRPLGFRSFGF